MPWEDGSFYPAETRALEVLEDADLLKGEASVHSTLTTVRDQFHVGQETFWVEMMYWPKQDPNDPADASKLHVIAATATERLMGDPLLRALRHVCEVLESSGDFEILTEDELGGPLGGEHASPWRKGGEMRATAVRIVDEALIL